MTQEKQVLNHLERFGSITAWEAMQEYRIMRLASRIADLRRKGHNIVTITRHNGSVSWAEYKKRAVPGVQDRRTAGRWESWH